MTEKREIWIDWLRVTACFMVMTVHSTEPFYLCGDGAQVLTAADAFWAAFFDSITRACVALFIVASSYLQFPLHYSSGEFLKRRAVRILIPFAFWTMIYALIYGQPLENFKGLLLNFNYSAGHLWFVYMLIGLYLLMPLLSPWAEKTGKRELQVYLAIWLFTTLIPYIKDIALGASYGITSGPTGIPMQYDYPLWGEASWNGYGVFYYVSGFIGYLFLGLYFRKFVPELNWKRTLAIALPCFAAGFAICFGGFHSAILRSAGGSFPVCDGLQTAVRWETTLFNDTLGVALMTIGIILPFRKIKGEGKFYRKAILPVSKASYGMYLCHMIVLALFSTLFRNTLGIGHDGALGFWTTAVEILATAICSYICVALLSVTLQRIPKIGKYIIG